mgnify:CR=1 FL=1
MGIRPATKAGFDEDPICTSTPQGNWLPWNRVSDIAVPVISGVVKVPHLAAHSRLNWEPERCMSFHSFPEMLEEAFSLPLWFRRRSKTGPSEQKVDVLGKPIDQAPAFGEACAALEQDPALKRRVLRNCTQYSNDPVILHH